MSIRGAFEKEVWVWCFFAISATLLRLIARLLKGQKKNQNGKSFVRRRRRLQVDDWVMIITLLFYIVDIVCANIAVKTIAVAPSLPGYGGVPPGPPPSGSPPPNINGTSGPPPPPPPPPSNVAKYLTSLLIARQVPPTTPPPPPGVSSSTVSTQIFGAEMIMVVEQLQIGTIWLVKACLLTTYYKVTKDLLWQNLAVKIISIYVAAGFVVMEVLYFGYWCRPFTNYFPTSNTGGPLLNPQCTKHTNHFILNAVLNISSDIAILCVMLPLFARTRLPLREKLMLCGAFGLGVLVILWAALSKWWTLTHRFDVGWLLYYIRESSTAVIVANIPVVLPMLRSVGRTVRESLSCSRSGASSGRHILSTDNSSPPPSSTGATTSSTLVSSQADDLGMHFLSLDEIRKAEMTWEVDDAEVSFRDRLKSPDVDERYLSVVQTQKKYIAPWAEPSKSDDSAG